MRQKCERSCYLEKVAGRSGEGTGYAKCRVARVGVEVEVREVMDEGSDVGTPFYAHVST